MNVSELLKKVNSCVDRFDFVSARRFIEENIDLISDNRHHLESNARALLDILKNEKDSTVKNLTRQEMNVIFTLNTYASQFNVQGIKTAVKFNPEVLLRKDVKYYLNEDAKTVLIGMNALQKDE